MGRCETGVYGPDIQRALLQRALLIPRVLGIFLAFLDGDGPWVAEKKPSTTTWSGRPYAASRRRASACPLQRRGLLLRAPFFLAAAFLTEALRAWMGDRLRSASA
jgi:hypothetical protein